MTASSDTPVQPARNLLQLLMRRIAAVKNQTLSVAIGRDESTVSRIVSGETGIRLTELQAFLDALGVKVVDANQYCVPRDLWEAYRVIAARSFEQPVKLDWEGATE